MEKDSLPPLNPTITYLVVNQDFSSLEVGQIFVYVELQIYAGQIFADINRGASWRAAHAQTCERGPPSTLGN